MLKSVGEPIEITNCVAIAEYIGSDEIDDYFMKIDTESIPYYYQDCEIGLTTLNVVQLHLVCLRELFRRKR